MVNALEGLRAAQIGALRNALGDRVVVTVTGSVLVDGRSIDDMLADLDALVGSGLVAADIVDQVRVAIGDPDPFGLGVGREPEEVTN